MAFDTEQNQHPYGIIYAVNVLAWLVVLQQPLLLGITQAFILACLSFIPSTIAVGFITVSLERFRPSLVAEEHVEKA